MGALEPVPGDYKGEGSHEDDNSSAELQKVREENDFLKRQLGETKTKLDKVTEHMRSLWRANCSLLRVYRIHE